MFDVSFWINSLILQSFLSNRFPHRGTYPAVSTSICVGNAHFHVELQDISAPQLLNPSSCRVCLGGRRQAENTNEWKTAIKWDHFNVEMCTLASAPPAVLQHSQHLSPAGKQTWSQKLPTRIPKASIRFWGLKGSLPYCSSLLLDPVSCCCIYCPCFCLFLLFAK